MTAKQYLSSYHRIACNYKASVKEYKSVDEDMITIKSPSFDERVKSSPQNDPIGEIVINLEKQKAMISVRMLNFQSRMSIIRNQLAELEAVNSEYYTVLMLRYILDEDWKSICSKLHMSRSQANVIHGKALEEFDRMFSEVYINVV